MVEAMETKGTSRVPSPARGSSPRGTRDISSCGSNPREWLATSQPSSKAWRSGHSDVLAAMSARCRASYRPRETRVA
jgi:hypothetical protein